MECDEDLEEYVINLKKDASKFYLLPKLIEINRVPLALAVKDSK